MNNKTNWWMIVAIIAIVLLIFGGSGIMGYNNYYRYGGMGSMMSWMFSAYPFMGFFMILFWAVLVLLVIWIVKQIQRPRIRKR